MLLIYHHLKFTNVPENAISDFWKVSTIYTSNYYSNDTSYIYIIITSPVVVHMYLLLIIEVY